MWQVWSKDLRQFIDERSMDKRKKYLLSQMTTQVIEMKKWVPDSFSNKIDEALVRYQNIQQELDKPEIMRSISLMEGQLRRT